MPRILKYSSVTVDDENRVKIEVPHVAIEDKLEDQPTSPDKMIDEMLKKAIKGSDIIIRGAHAKADKMIDEAEEKSQEIIQSAYDQNFDRGYDEGYQKGIADTEALKLEAAKALEDALAQRAELFASCEIDMLHLVVKTVKKLLGSAVSFHDDIILTLITKGLNASMTSGDILIRVSEADHSTVIAYKNDIAKQIEASSEFDIIKDLSLSKGDCIIETPYGNIDSSLDSQFKHLIEAMYTIYDQNE